MKSHKNNLKNHHRGWLRLVIDFSSRRRGHIDFNERKITPSNVARDWGFCGISLYGNMRFLGFFFIIFYWDFSE